MTPLAGQVLRLVAGVFAVGGLLLFLGQRLGRRPADHVWKLYWSQVAVTTWMVVPALLGGWFFKGAMMVTSAVATWELFGVLQRLGVKPFRRVGIAVSVAYGLLALLGLTELLQVAPLLFALAMLLAPLFLASLQGTYARAAVTLLGTFYPGLCLTFAIRLPELGNGLGDFVFLYGVLEVNDAFAFLFGKYLGKRKLSRLSPNKTVVGSLGGIFSGTVAAGLASSLMPGFAWWQCALIGALLSGVGMSADLVASAIKREAGVKDYSDLVPMQGGMLDLFDAFIFTVPVWFLVLKGIR